ncbi:Glycoside hydrolase, family 17 [Corchorus capsularis]|uniref:glucan endo-1,3-beta-D-glucosidase n=1 Tax=Corchorus capsularis TaxID=210143 RepID=A0A1R3GCW6_COCAP|nr:Glycoside hydrolase, family 17 [Corchorus capsularis]
MVRAMALWAGIILILVAAGVVVGADIGVNLGAQSSHPLHPSIVVNLLKDNGMKKVKLFDSDPWYVAVGNEPFLSSYNGAFTNQVFPALQNIQKALDNAGVGDKIKATIPLNSDVYESGSDKPSEGAFRGDIKELMTQIVHFYKENNSPFVVNIYPFISLYQNPDFPKDFAFFDGGHPITDKNIQYSNVFDANFDTLVYALKKAGVPDLKIIVGEVGWPTDGNVYATKDNAKKFYDGLFKKLASNKGTPLRPGKMEVYVFALFDEDLKSVLPGFFERHWGIFTFDGKPKFPMDFSGNQKDKLLVAAKGVTYLEKQWCVFDPTAGKQYLLPAQLDWACGHADCSSLTNGSSCGNHDATVKNSYAFNSFFQVNDQDVEACRFEGMGTIVKEDPSKGSCQFPIMIETAGVERLSLRFGVICAFVSFLSFFITLI